jgi:hypothetical protein
MSCAVPGIRRRQGAIVEPPPGWRPVLHGTVVPGQSVRADGIAISDNGRSGGHRAPFGHAASIPGPAAAITAMCISVGVARLRTFTPGKEAGTAMPEVVGHVTSPASHI